MGLRAMKQRVVLVTGGGTGIGAAITRRFLADGDAVVICQRSEDEARAAGSALAGVNRLHAVAADLRTPSGCRRAIDACMDLHGCIDVLVNNAAITGPEAVGPFMDFPEDRLDAILAVNLKAPFLCSQYAVRGMAAGGVIINIGSTAGFIAQPDACAYVAAKAGLVGLTKALALELADRDIRVVMVAPGAVATTTSSAAQYRRDRIDHPRRHAPLIDSRAEPEEVAQAVTYVCSAAARFMTGSCLILDGGVLSY